MAKSRFISMAAVLTSRNIFFQLRLRLVNCYIYSVLLYGSETWTLNKNLESRIEAFEMWIFRRMGKISWTEKKTNKDVCMLLKVSPSLLNNIKRKKLKYFGHIKRHDTICREILEGKIEGRRARGRQRRTWLDDIRDWTKLSVTECAGRARDRKEWRVISSRPR